MKKIKIAVWIGFFALSGCVGVGDYFQANQYIVQTGDTLNTVAFRYQIDVSDLTRWNNFSSNRLLKQGETIFVRDPTIDPRRPPAPTPEVKEKPRVVAKRPAPAVVERKKPTSSVITPAYHKNSYNWPWPTEGKLIKDSSAKNILKGLKISGTSGQDIRAVSDGNVIYSGNGLTQYGNLVIIKHADSLLSAYAHNQKNLVIEKEKIKKGQVIATMGEKNKKGYLYFEIRKKGKIVNPLHYLKKQ